MKALYDASMDEKFALSLPLNFRRAEVSSELFRNIVCVKLRVYVQILKWTVWQVVLWMCWSALERIGMFRRMRIKESSEIFGRMRLKSSKRKHRAILWFYSVERLTLENQNCAEINFLLISFIKHPSVTSEILYVARIRETFLSVDPYLTCNALR